MTPRPPAVRVLADAAAAVPLLLDEVRGLAQREPGALLGFATGGTYTQFLRALAAELPADRLLATHLDEYLGFGPDRRGGMVHELGQSCPPVLDMLRRGRFLPVPRVGDAATLGAHEQRLQRAGGVALQLLGIGRNGHIAFNEPGTPFDSEFHVTTLAETTRADARARFAPDEPPLQAVTSGLATILRARRLVLCAFGKPKAEAVRAMLTGDLSPACPASLVRRHPDVLVLLDHDAASLLTLGQASA